MPVAVVGGSWPCTYPAGLAAGSSSRYDQVAACEVMPSSAYRKLLEALTLTLTLTLTRTLSLSLTLTLTLTLTRTLTLTLTLTLTRCVNKQHISSAGYSAS